MAVKVDHFEKDGRVEANGKPAQSSASTSGKKTEHSNVFKTLLNELRFKESHPTDSLRNKPASSEMLRHDNHNTLKNHGAIRYRNAQDVNNLSASTLIALAAISSGPNRLAGLHPGVSTSSILPGTASSRGAAYSSALGVGTNLYSGQQVGALSAYFESGEKGPGVIGYDPSGGTSYGTYQISSRAGSMKRFIDYLSTQAPDLASKLEAAGPANTGSRSGRMPEVWKKISSVDPERFEKLQYDFIDKTHYQPALQEISARTGLDVSTAPRALQEVLWSTAVQHGPNGAVKIFTKAIKQAHNKNDGIKLAQLIGSVYDIRASRFNSSGLGIRTAARHRFMQEGRIALSLLTDPLLNSQGIKA